VAKLKSDQPENLINGIYAHPVNC